MLVSSGAVSAIVVSIVLEEEGEGEIARPTLTKTIEVKVVEPVLVSPTFFSGDRQVRQEIPVPEDPWAEPDRKPEKVLTMQNWGEGD